VKLIAVSQGYHCIILWSPGLVLIRAVTAVQLSPGATSRAAR